MVSMFFFAVVGLFGQTSFAANLAAHFPLVDGQLTDVSGNNVCTLTLDPRVGDGASVTTSAEGLSCPKFSGSEGCAKCSYSNNMPSGNTPLTITFWVKLDASTNDNVGIVEFGVPGNHQVMSVGLRGGKQLYFMTWGDLHGSNFHLTNDVWHYVAMTYSDKNVQIFVDGLSKATATFSQPLNIPTNGFIAVGSEADGNEGFTGMLKDVRIYGEHLSVADMQNAACPENAEDDNGTCVCSAGFANFGTPASLNCVDVASKLGDLEASLAALEADILQKAESIQNDCLVH